MTLALTSTTRADDEGKAVVETRHPEFTEFHTVWRWLEDSLEGGERYREADYGFDPYVSTWTYQDPETGKLFNQTQHHQIPRRNLIRHPQEYPQQGGPGAQAGMLEGSPSTADEYEFRRALTPVPEFVGEAVGAHLARIYSREVRREAPDGPAGDLIRAWWADVDGCGTPIDAWMSETIAPLFLALGQLDLAFDHPPAPEGTQVRTQADVLELGLGGVVASYILPENLTDWSLGRDRRYRRAVVREWSDGGIGRYREWTDAGWTLYESDGKPVARGEHKYRRVPIYRAVDVRKHRCCNVGQSRYDAIAQLMRAYYNVDSELTLANSLAAHALLSGPEEYCRGDQIAVGPGNVLPKKRDASGGSYEGWDYVCPPSEAADRLRTKLQDIRDAVDRSACLTKPAGTQGTDGRTVSQSGISKMLDQTTGNDLLSKISKALERLELRAVEYVLAVATNGVPDKAILDQVTLAYPTKFDLFTAADFAGLIVEFDGIKSGVDGDLPVMTATALRTFARLWMPGLDDETYEQIDAEIDTFIAKKAADASARAEMPPLMPPPAGGPPPPDPNAEPQEPLPGDDVEAVAA